MKALLVIDVPIEMLKCNTCVTITSFHSGMSFDAKLKPMPDIKTEEAIKLANMINPKVTFQEFADGWNACLEELEK